MKTTLSPLIDASLRSLRQLSVSGFEPARMVESQLRWCWLRINGLAFDPPPSPLCMTWLVETEFNKYGGQPLLWAQLREIEDGMKLIALGLAA
jgi:hypothetical protein